MLRSKWRTRARLALCVATVGAAASGFGGHAHADINKSGTETGGEVISPGASLHAACWQQGTKIIDRDGLDSLDIGSNLRERILAFGLRGDTTDAVIVVPLGETVCLITPAERR